MNTAFRSDREVQSAFEREILSRLVAVAIFYYDNGGPRGDALRRLHA